MRSLKIF